jgi:hypothetical protein
MNHPILLRLKISHYPFLLTKSGEGTGQSVGRGPGRVLMLMMILKLATTVDTHSTRPPRPSFTLV